MIRLPRVLLRPWTADDVPALVRHANNVQIAKFLTDRFPSPYTRSDAERWVTYCGPLTEKTQMAIEYNSEAVGNVGITINKDIYRKTAEVGYWVGEACWGAGIMSEALAGFTAYCFEQFGLNRIYARVFESNVASARVLAKCGYAYKCKLEKEILKDEEIHNALLYEKIA